MNKKLIALGLTGVLTIAMLAGCSSAPAEAPAEEAPVTEAPAAEEAPAEEAVAEEAAYEDGLYFAKSDAYSEKSGWKETVTLEVKDGKISIADWNAVSIKAGLNKEEASKAGFYPMVEAGGAQAAWHEQAEIAEAHLIATQDPTDINYSDDEGHTDALTGVSIHVSEFFQLAEKALAAGPVEQGPYKDGAYHAEEAAFSENSGWKYTVDLTVMFGNIESVYWSGAHKDGGDDKKTLSINGEYQMVEKAGAQAPWFEQAAKVEAILLESQDPTAIEYAEDGVHTDAITGVSISVSPFFTLAQEALAEAK